MKAIQKKANGFDCATPLDAGKLERMLADVLNEVGKIKYALRYLSSSWKGVQKDEIEAILEQGLGLFLFYETDPTHDSYFTVKRGYQDAADAQKLAEAINLPKNVGICYTVDEGTQDFSDVLTYFQTIRKADNGYPIGAYGDYDVIQHLQKHNAADFYIQTYAWSDNKIADNLAAMQFMNGQNLGGVSVDLEYIFDDKYAWKSSGHVPAPKEQTDAAHVTEQENTYTIQKGDTLWGLETKWDLAHGTLEHINPQIKNPSDIYPGEVIHVPGAVRIDKRQPHEKPHTYIVRSGDTLSKIAAKHHTTVSELMRLNPQIKNKNEIYVGDHIVLPVGHHHVAHEYHTIQHGETLSGIAKRYHTTVGHLLNLNPNITNKNKIYAGERVRIK